MASLRGTDLAGYGIKINNSNGAPNSPNAIWNDIFKITYYLDPSTVDSRPFVTEVRLLGNSPLYFEGDLQGYTFFSPRLGYEDGSYSSTNTGEFTTNKYFGGGVGLPPSTNDLVYASSYSDTLKGLTGNDTLYGYGGDDVLEGGTGDDFLYGGDGNDVFSGGSGNDFIFGGSGSDTIDYALSEVGMSVYMSDSVLENTTTGETYSAKSFAENVNSEIDNFFEIENVLGSEVGNDVIHGNSQDNIFFGLGGNDMLSGGAGDDHLGGDSGDDVIWGGAGNDYLLGGTGSDVLAGGLGNDIYIWNIGDGTDSVVETIADAGNDMVAIQGASSFFIAKSGDDLALTTTGEEWLILADWYSNPGVEYFNIEGYIYNASDVAAMAVELTSTQQTQQAPAQPYASYAMSDIATENYNEITINGVQLEPVEMLVA